MIEQENRYAYPAVFGKEEGDSQIGVVFPDLPGCVVCADTQGEALESAKDALALHLWGMEDDGDEIPPPSAAESIELEEWQTLAVIEAWMPPVRDRMANSSVNKIISLPGWLDRAGRNANLNFSQILQDALLERLEIRQEQTAPNSQTA